MQTAKKSSYLAGRQHSHLLLLKPLHLLALVQVRRGKTRSKSEKGSKHKQALPPATARSKSFGAAVSTHQVVQRAAASLKCLGAQAQVVDERVDEATLTAARRDEFCKIALHVYDNQQPVVGALRCGRREVPSI